MIFDNRLRIFLEFMEKYPNDKPLHKFFPEFYKRNKQMGSRDRRTLSHQVYSFFRIGRVLPQLPPDERLFIALLVCNEQEDDFLLYFRPEWKEISTGSLEQKFSFLHKFYPGFDPEQLFPFAGFLSDSIDKDAFIHAQLKQPDLFLRALKGKEDKLQKLLDTQHIPYTNTGTCFRLANSTNVLSEEYLFEIQDQSSQHTGSYFEAKPGDYWWDCCAASGGKSLMLADQQPSVKLFVSDIRESVLNNLDERFKRAGVKNYTRRIIDLLSEISSIQHNTFDGLILDAPCSGSGTWGRSPEMISQFQEFKINYFSDLQKTIADNAIQFLKFGQPLIYITCSAFQAENEDVVDFLVREKGMQLERMETIKGYEHGADTMFVARLIKK